MRSNSLFSSGVRTFQQNGRASRIGTKRTLAKPRLKVRLRVDFDRRLKLEFHGSKVTTDAGLLA